ncbi:hypothetical protein [Mycoplasma tauri]|uniref:hypothetical protein n=1 Tax=Mycoplasma tauri TaxID=547987 RepID=UPI001CBCC038|nr:hypothetical protein [Mycoplasma tauri]
MSLKNNKSKKGSKKSIFSKKILYSSIALASVIGVSTAISIKYTHFKFKPVFWNYQSYMNEYSINKLSKNFEYKEFSVLNDFTQAILTHKAAGGIGSDNQAAKLIINENIGKSHLRKFTDKDFKTIFKGKWNSELSRKENLKNNYTKLVLEHLESYDKYFEDLPVYDEFGKIIENKKQKDLLDDDPKKIHLYDYFIPYFSQDMVIAYNPLKLDKYKNYYKSPGQNLPEPNPEKPNELPEYLKKYEEGVNSYFRKVHSGLEHQINKKIIEIVNDENKNFKENQEGKIQKHIPMIDALKLMRNPFGQNNETDSFHYFEYTDAVRDNMIYGSSYRLNTKSDRYEPEPTGKAVVIEETNITNRKVETDIYPALIDQFVKMFKDGTSYDIKNTKHVKTSGNGQELLNTLIDPEKNTNVGIIYNGDALDAFYARDNILNSNTPDGAIRFIRPSINLLLVDGLIIASDTKDDVVEKLLEIASKTFYAGVDKEVSEWQEKVSKLIDSQGTEKEKDDTNKEIGAYLNYDFIRYTPAFKNFYQYILENEFSKEAFEKLYPGFSDEFVEYQRAYATNLYKIDEEYDFIGFKPNPNNPKDKDLKEIKPFKYHVKHLAIAPVSNRIQTKINIYYDSKLKN